MCRHLYGDFICRFFGPLALMGAIRRYLPRPTEPGLERALANDRFQITKFREGRFFAVYRLTYADRRKQSR